MRRCYAFVLTAFCAAAGCQSTSPGLDPFLGPQRIAPPATGAAQPNGAAPYFPPGGPVVTPGTPSNSLAPPAAGGAAPAGGTYNYTPSSARTDGTTSPSRALVPQTAASTSAIALPGKSASWSSGASGESVKIVEPPAGVTQASFTSSAPRTATPTLVEAGPLVDITNLPDAKRK